MYPPHTLPHCSSHHPPTYATPSCPPPSGASRACQGFLPRQLVCAQSNSCPLSTQRPRFKRPSAFHTATPNPILCTQCSKAPSDLPPPPPDLLICTSTPSRPRLPSWLRLVESLQPHSRGPSFTPIALHQHSPGYETDDHPQPSSPSSNPQPRFYHPSASNPGFYLVE